MSSRKPSLVCARRCRPEPRRAMEASRLSRPSLRSQSNRPESRRNQPNRQFRSCTLSMDSESRTARRARERLRIPTPPTGGRVQPIRSEWTKTPTTGDRFRRGCERLALPSCLRKGALPRAFSATSVEGVSTTRPSASHSPGETSVGPFSANFRKHSSRGTPKAIDSAVAAIAASDSSPHRNTPVSALPDEAARQGSTQPFAGFSDQPHHRR